MGASSSISPPRSADPEEVAVAWLLKNGYTTMMSSKEDGDHPLLSAAREGNMLIVIWILARDRKALSRSNNVGETSLDVAAMHGHLSLWKFLHSIESLGKPEEAKLGFTVALHGDNRLFVESIVIILR
jgi:hypothetical protein